MKIALCSSFVPFIKGGARNIVDWLEVMLTKAGHEVEIVYLPQVDVPDLLFRQMMAYRWVDLEAADRIICFRPQAHLIPHPHKILWFIHHIRSFYDLWDTPYRGFPDDKKHKEIRQALQRTDTLALQEAKKIFTNSQIISTRLRDFNGIDSEVLYPPVFKPERFYSRGFNDEIICICRLEHHKRQHLLIEAMAYTRTKVKLRLSGTGLGENYPEELRKRIRKLKLEERVALDDRWISEEEKIEQLADCLAVAYVPMDEDSYGYPSIEGSLAGKCVLTVNDSGGVMELVEDGFNGYVADPKPRALAKAMDRLYVDREKTKQMGRNATDQLMALNISWDHVLERLLS